ncbi:hypothetical protein BDN72DRAFT_907349 [Pluteus cervinus]|uniref:Uncharacterized protein n=1 Tax=Pluteus cervinus TaxID=181527 RepID=A0ACD2ZX62_9AGAR|nr:hypothetical protein BDN72DRAFT_907349 [Pluteus cervinus]
MLNGEQAPPVHHVLQVFHAEECSDEFDRKTMILGCFPNVSSLLLADPDYASGGLAGFTPSDRLSPLLAFARLLSAWPQCPDAVRNANDLSLSHWDDEAAIVELEEAAALFYTQTFFKSFGRAPSIPHRLDPVFAQS